MERKSFIGLGLVVAVLCRVDSACSQSFLPFNPNVSHVKIESIWGVWEEESVGTVFRLSAAARTETDLSGPPRSGTLVDVWETYRNDSTGAYGARYASDCFVGGATVSVQVESAHFSALLDMSKCLSQGGNIYDPASNTWSSWSFPAEFPVILDIANATGGSKSNSVGVRKNLVSGEQTKYNCQSNTGDGGVRQMSVGAVTKPMNSVGQFTAEVCKNI